MSVAWLATASAEPGAVSARVWKTLIEDVLGPHIALTVDHDTPESLDRTFWNEVMRRATSAFIRLNQLEDPIQRSLSSICAHGEGSRQ